ncbi:MAG TPA: PEP-CTERM sorting domain-containing protein [Verrucomicrobiae bacterium]|nr:PEP-CTERM sorting domain-containing protein [Verrucomicrobiae bacterium]
MSRLKSSVIVFAAAIASAFTASQASADWTQFSLPNLADIYSPTAIANLPDGRYIFANEGNYYQQDAFGSAGYTAYSNTAPGNNADPSFLAVWDSTHAVAGGGMFGSSDLYGFNPSSTTSPAFTANGLSIQNYSGVYRDATSLYVGGLNGSGFTHAISYVNLTTETTKVIIDDVSTYSGGFARDAAGDLFVGDTDNGDVYEFTAAQLTLAISGPALSIADGTFVHQFGTGLGTLAVDAQGRIWSAGYAVNGLQMFDPATDTETDVIPGLTNANYMVTTFSVGGQGYAAYTDEVNPGQAGTAQYYGFEAIPEPGTLVLTLAGFAALAACRGKRNQ